MTVPRRFAGRRRALVAKRVLDVVGAAVGLLLLGPLLAVTALAIALLDGTPVLFRQVRPGRGGRPFTILKFRTMRAPRTGEVWFETDGLRVSPLGRLLRMTSLDELPELWNVLRGEMSLVGPRPLLMEYLDTYTPAEQRRHDVLPGITGWAAVNGRHAIRFDKRLALDVWYVDHWSFGLDLRILARTVVHVLQRTGVSTTQDGAELGARLPYSTRPRGPDRVPAAAVAPAVDERMRA